MTNKKGIAIIGSTSFYGEQIVQVVKQFPDLFTIEIMWANTSYETLIQQAIEFDVNVVVVADENRFQSVKDELWEHDIQVYTGDNIFSQIFTFNTIDLVVTTGGGLLGTKIVMEAILGGKNVLLGNIDPLVIAGELISQTVGEKGVNIYPITPSQSGLFQCISGEFHNKVDKAYLFDNGGIFRNKSFDEMKEITPMDVFKYPQQEIDNVTCVNNATLIQLGFEVIASKWLFGLTSKQIEVMIHPEEIVQGMVQFEDGNIKSLLFNRNLKSAIQYGFTYPHRLNQKQQKFNFLDYPNLNFGFPDVELFKNLSLAYQALEKGASSTLALYCSNQLAVEKFLQEKIDFLSIAVLNEQAINEAKEVKITSLEDVERLYFVEK